MRLLARRVREGAQGLRDPDQGQADEGGGVAALHALEQRNPESFALEAAGAVVRGFARDIIFDLEATEPAEYAARFVAVTLPESRLDADNGYGGMEGDHLPGEALEHGDLCRPAARLAKALLLESADLVRADDEGAGLLFGDRARLGQGESLGKRCGGLTRVPGLIDLGTAALEDKLQSAEQFPAIAGARGQPERTREGYGTLFGYGKQRLIPKLL